MRDHLSSEPISVLMFASATVRRSAEEHILELLSRLDRRHFRHSLAQAGLYHAFSLRKFVSEMEQCYFEA